MPDEARPVLEGLRAAWVPAQHGPWWVGWRFESAAIPMREPAVGSAHAGWMESAGGDAGRVRGHLHLKTVQFHLRDSITSPAALNEASTSAGSTSAPPEACS